MGKKERRRKRKEAGIDDLPVPGPRLALQKSDNESELDWITRQWRSAYRNGLTHQFSEPHDEESSRWIYQFPRVPKNWIPQRNFKLNHEYWSIPVPLRPEEYTQPEEATEPVTPSTG